ncbi:hypothetical protein R4Z10_05385 [Niallia sp. XMNu-256]|uniref:UPF0738 family protein n=1 Tax=Niallia sp. XMNu-256 TaxID=3082444 RepID=UPI0030D17E63
MSEKLIIQESTIINEKEVVLEVEEQVTIENFKASGQMLVDSDNLSFVYLMENEEGYTYIVLPTNNWKDLKTILENNGSVYLSNKKERLLLTNFQEELSYLIDNIKGNSNYGEKMVTEVETVFA